MSSGQITDPEGPIETTQDKNMNNPTQEIGSFTKAPAVTDATTESNMAPRNVDQGRKRPLSLSPQGPKFTGKEGDRVPEPTISPTPAQHSKKRFISTHISDFFNAKSKTGNDPLKGQTLTGYDSPKGQPRTESNMAVPMFSNMADINKVSTSDENPPKDLPTPAINLSKGIVTPSVSPATATPRVNPELSSKTSIAESSPSNSAHETSVEIIDVPSDAKADPIPLKNPIGNPKGDPKGDLTPSVGLTFSSPNLLKNTIKGANPGITSSRPKSPTPNTFSKGTNPNVTSSHPKSPTFNTFYIGIQPPTSNKTKLRKGCLPTPSPKPPSPTLRKGSPPPASSKPALPTKSPKTPQGDLRKLRSRPVAPVNKSGFMVCCSPCCKPDLQPNPNPPNSHAANGNAPKTSYNQGKPGKTPTRGRGRSRKIQNNNNNNLPNPLSSPPPAPSTSPVSVSSNQNNVSSLKHKTLPPSPGNKLPQEIDPLLPQGTDPVVSTPSPSSEEKQPQKMDIYDLLLEIKGKQEKSDVKFETVIENKMKDLKSTLGVEINNAKFDTENNAKLLTDMRDIISSTDLQVLSLCNKTTSLGTKLDKQNQYVNEIDDKMVTLDDKTNVIEGELLKLKSDTDQTNLSLVDMVTNVEHELVSHMETIKSNVEKEISSSNQNQIHVENRLNNFAREVDTQAIEMNNKILELKSDFENLKTISNRATSNSSIPLPAPHKQFSQEPPPIKRLMYTLLHAQIQISYPILPIRKMNPFTCTGIPLALSF